MLERWKVGDVWGVALVELVRCVSSCVVGADETGALMVAGKPLKSRGVTVKVAVPVMLGVKVSVVPLRTGFTMPVLSILALSVRLGPDVMFRISSKLASTGNCRGVIGVKFAKGRFVSSGR